jgi:hypothetical protein
MTLSSSIITAAVTLLVAGGAQVAAQPAAARKDAPVRVAVLSPAVAKDPQIRAAVSAAGAQLRVPRTPTEQLSVTHLFAAEGATIVGAGLDRRVAVDPVAERFPSARFVLLGAHPAAGRVRAALGS